MGASRRPADFTVRRGLASYVRNSILRGLKMGRIFTGRDVVNWKVVTSSGEVLKYPKGYQDEKKVGKPMNDLDGFKSANKLAQKYGGFAVRV